MGLSYHGGCYSGQRPESDVKLSKEVRMRAITVFLLVLTLGVLVSVPAAAQTRSGKPLQIYVVDVEGGNGTLFVSPSGESLLMDTGNAGAVAAPRDAGRILDA